MNETTLGKRLLVVDKDQKTLKDVEAVLLEQGYSVNLASCLEEIYKLVEAEKVDMVLMDINSLEEEGVDAYETLKARFPDLPVVVTAHNS